MLSSVFVPQRQPPVMLLLPVCQQILSVPFCHPVSQLWRWIGSPCLAKPHE
ncbi:MAG: hypothetical protein HY744_12790 [Deltaproteobacteria bacterium]|nr:hypothetical protein [Deltaproteobacteria bacterium]